MTAGVIVYGVDGNFELAHKTWKFLEKFEYDIVFSVSQGLITESRIKDIFPNSNFYRCIDDSFNETDKILHLIKKGFSFLKKNYDCLILIKLNSYMIAENGFDFLYDCIENDSICGYRPIKLIGSKLFHVPDYFFIGKYDNMVKLILNLPDESETDITNIIATILLQNELYVKDIGPFFNMEEVYNNILPNQLTLTPYELKIKSAEWKQKK